MPNKRLPIHKLSPAASRLLLSLFTAEADGIYDEIVQRSGINAYVTFATARNQLRELGFLYVREGKEYPTLYAQEEPVERATEPVATMWPGAITKITNAKQ